MSLPPDFKPAWDVNKHDAKIEDRPKEEFIDFRCKCGCETFMPMHNIQLHKITQKGEVAVGLKFSPPAMACIKCREVYKPDHIIGLLKKVDADARKRSHLQAVESPEKNPS